MPTSHRPAKAPAACVKLPRRCEIAIVMPGIWKLRLRAQENFPIPHTSQQTPNLEHTAASAFRNLGLVSPLRHVPIPPWVFSGWRVEMFYTLHIYMCEKLWHNVSAHLRNKHVTSVFKVRITSPAPATPSPGSGDNQMLQLGQPRVTAASSWCRHMRRRFAKSQAPRHMRSPRHVPTVSEVITT